MFIRGIALAAALGFVACTQPAPLSDVENDADRWSLVPSVHVGAQFAGPGEIELTEVREVVIGQDGDLYVLQHQDRVVLVLDSAGRLQRRIGGPGEGPGEFTNPWHIGWDRHGLWVAEQGRSRISRFYAAGDLIGVETPRTPDAPPMTTIVPIGRFDNGSYLSQPIHAANLISSGQIVESYLLRTDLSGFTLDTLATLPLINTVLHLRNSSNPRSRSLRGPQPIRSGAFYGLDPTSQHLVVVTQESDVDSSTGFTVSKMNSHGAVVWARSYGTVGVPMQSSLRDSLIGHYADIALETDMFASRSSAREGVREVLYLPHFLPPIAGVFVATDGAIWLRRAEQRDNVEYTVLSADGRVLTSTFVPSDVSLLAADSRFAWGTRRGAYDVPYLIGFEIRK